MMFIDTIVPKYISVLSRIVYIYIYIHIVLFEDSLSLFERNYGKE